MKDANAAREMLGYFLFITHQRQLSKMLKMELSLFFKKLALSYVLYVQKQPLLLRMGRGEELKEKAVYERISHTEWKKFW